MEERIARVLLVEDSESDAAAATRSLRSYNTAIAVLKDGFQAMEYLLEISDPKGLPEVVLLDLSLPGIHGLDVLRKIKANEKTKHLHVVILTGNQEEKMAMDCYKLKCDGVLLKPLTPETADATMKRFGISRRVE